MSPLAFYRQMITSGMDEATAYRLAEQFETEEGAKAEARYEALLSRLAKPIDKAADKRREWDRQRKAEQLAAKKSGGNPVESTRTQVEPVEIHPRQDAPAPVHTRGEETLPRLVDKPNLTTLQRERDWKIRSNLEWLDSQLREAGGPAIANMAIAPGLADMSIIIGLLTGGTGPPCDLEADVLPIVRARCIGRKLGSVRNWSLFRDAIREARDRRLTGAPAIEAVHQGNRHERPPPPSAKFAAKQANMDRAFNGAQRAIARAAR